jgi:hypothetical protein
MSEYTPTVEEVREDYRNGVWNDGLGIWGDSVAEVFDRWLARVRAEAGAAALEALARGEKYLAETIGEDIDTRGRTRLLEVARRIRKHGTTAPEGEHTDPTGGQA